MFYIKDSFYIKGCDKALNIFLSNDEAIYNINVYRTLKNREIMQARIHHLSRRIYNTYV